MNLNHIRWAAWGVIDIEKLERMQRRNYIKRARAELVEIAAVLSCGGSKSVPWYSITLPTTTAGKTAGGPDAFRRVCEWLLIHLEDKEHSNHERGEDGSVRCVGDGA